MNAATILNFLIKKNFIKVNQKKILQISKLIGSDVILGINPKSAILSSNGIVKKFSKTSRFNIFAYPSKFWMLYKKNLLRSKKF